MRALLWFLAVLLGLAVLATWLGPVTVAAIIGIVVSGWMYLTVKALRIVRRRCQDLATITGIPAEMIRRDVTRRQITPGEWAAQHDLDPMTFQPRR